MHTKYSKYYSKIEIQKYNFEKIIEKIKKESSFENKLSYALYALNYAVYNNCGYYTSHFLENFFLEYAKKIKVDLSNIQYKKNTYLHVLTQGYNTGGHTRVAERWIKNAPKDENHSVVILKPNKENLDLLQNNVEEKNGKLIYFDKNLSVKKRALDLRKLAMEYEYVILHVDMDDPIAVVAFGVEEFKRPVLFYNHASHLFWIGKSVADLVLDIEFNDEVTRNKRKIDNAYFLGVPLNKISISKTEKQEARKKLNLPVDKKIIVSSGHEMKYVAICDDFYGDIIEKIIDKDTYCYIVGVNKDNIEWNKLKEKSKGRIIPVGRVDYFDGYIDYLKACDLYLDSYPFCGGVACIEAISCGVGVLSLKSIYPQFDYLIRTSAYCDNKQDFIEKAKKMLYDKNFSDEILDEITKSLIEHQSLNVWKDKINELFKMVPKKHNVKELSFDEYFEIDDLAVLCNTMLNKDFLTKEIKKISDFDLCKILINLKIKKVIHFVKKFFK